MHVKTNQGAEALYKQEIDLLKGQLVATLQQHQDQLKEQGRITDEKISIAESKRTSITIYWLLIIAAAVTGILLGRGCK